MSKINIKIKRLWAGRADIRSYNYEDAVKKQKTIVFHYDGKTMTITPAKLLLGEHRTSNLFKSKTGGKDYYLVSFVWKSDLENKIEQVEQKTPEIINQTLF